MTWGREGGRKGVEKDKRAPKKSERQTARCRKEGKEGKSQTGKKVWRDGGSVGEKDMSRERRKEPNNETCPTQGVATLAKQKGAKNTKKILETQCGEMKTFLGSPEKSEGSKPPN